jgi:hypothetical protein
MKGLYFMSTLEILALIVLIPSAIGCFRVYVRTNQIGILFLMLGCSMGAFGILLDFFDFSTSVYLLVFSYILIPLGLILQVTKESGTRKYIFDNTTFYQRILGDVPVIKENIKPQFSKMKVIFWGIMTIGIGVARILIKKTPYNEDLAPLGLSISTIIWGILMIFAAIIWGKENDRK